jgi:hypothetical protein
VWRAVKPFSSGGGCRAHPYCSTTVTVGFKSSGDSSSEHITFPFNHRNRNPHPKSAAE